MIVLFQQIKSISHNHFLMLILILVLTILIVHKIINKRKITLANQISGTNGYFIIGSSLMFTNGLENLLKSVLLLCKKYQYSIFKMWIFHKLFVYVIKAEDIEEVMNNSNCFKKPFVYSIISDTFSIDSIVTTNNIHDHKKNRKIITEWLKYSNLKLLISTFYEKSIVLKHVLSEKCEKKSYECDVSRIFELLSTGTIGRTALGEEFNTLKFEYNVLLKNYKHLLEIFGYRLVRPWFWSSILFSLSLKKPKQLKSLHIVNEYICDLVKKKYVELNDKAKSTINGFYNEDSNCQKSKTLIEILLENDHQIPSKQLRDELKAILAAGHDTISISNAAVIFMLAHHQNIQQNVFEECISIFSEGDSNRPPTYDDLQKMEYLERVIKETMRFYPPTPMIAREVENETKIGKYVIPADTMVVIPIFGLHLNPQYFKDPEKFNPDNFLPEVSRSRHSYAFLPFSAGSRNCVGMKYAMLQMKTTISTLVMSYRFSPSEKCPTPKDLRVSYNIILQFVDGCYVKIEPRT